MSCPRICYDAAYFILPHYAFHEFDEVEQHCSHSPETAGVYFYLKACQLRGSNPVVEDAKSLRWHVGRFLDRMDYHVLEYPTPPPVDFSGFSPEDLMGRTDLPVLAPHFSAFVRSGPADPIQYFILGQAPMGGGTTLRTITPGGANCNLGPGPEPSLDGFLFAIASAL